MSTIIDFPFQKKEGKYFTPIVSEETTYKVQNGAVVTDSTQLIAGIKGAYVGVRLTLPISFASAPTELFAINSEAVNSSN